MLIAKDTHRYSARVIIEMKTPLAIGSGIEDQDKGSLVLKDWNGLPYIPGSSLLGVLRSQLDPDQTDRRTFGIAMESEERNSEGEPIFESWRSRLTISSGLILDGNGQVFETLVTPAQIEKNIVFKWIQRLPVRDRVRIGHQGVGVSGGKFQKELVPKVTRFAFVLELDGLGDEAHLSRWQNILSTLADPGFRLGSDTRNGFGRFEICKINGRLFDFQKSEDLQRYVQLESLQTEFGEPIAIDTGQSFEKAFRSYTLNLSAVDYLIFCEQDPNVPNNQITKTEEVLEWNEAGAVVIKTKALIPATSIKGALAHRVAFHYNRSQGICVEKVIKDEMQTIDLQRISDFSEKELQAFQKMELLADKDLTNLKIDDDIIRTIEKSLTHLLAHVDTKVNNLDLAATVFNQYQNPAVKALFGFVDERKGEAEIGKVLIEDVYLENEKIDRKGFQHVAIDRFSGAGLEGALFSTTVGKIKIIPLQIEVLTSVGTEAYLPYLEMALDDLRNKKLPLGGMVNKGHGLVYENATS